MPESRPFGQLNSSTITTSRYINYFFSIKLSVPLKENGSLGVVFYMEA